MRLSSAHAFNYIVLRVNPSLTDCEDHAMALATIQGNTMHVACMYYLWYTNRWYQCIWVLLWTCVRHGNHTKQQKLPLTTLWTLTTSNHKSVFVYGGHYLRIYLCLGHQSCLQGTQTGETGIVYCLLIGYYGEWGCGRCMVTWRRAHYKMTMYWIMCRSWWIASGNVTSLSDGLWCIQPPVSYHGYYCIAQYSIRGGWHSIMCNVSY